MYVPSQILSVVNYNDFSQSVLTFPYTSFLFLPTECSENILNRAKKIPCRPSHD